MARFFQIDTDTIVEQGEELIDDVRVQIETGVDTVKENPELAAILLVIAVLTAIIFFWGVVKQAIKAAVIGGVLSAGAWYWYFNIR